MILEPWCDALREQTVNTSAVEGGWWQISDLIKAAEHEPEIEIPLDHLNFAYEDFEVKNLYEFAQHMKAAMEANLDFPIILDYRGQILDGRHRMVKALIEGRQTIKAKRLSKFIRPTGVR